MLEHDAMVSAGTEVAWTRSLALRIGGRLARGSTAGTAGMSASRRRFRLDFGVSAAAGPLLAPYTLSLSVMF